FGSSLGPAVAARSFTSLPSMPSDYPGMWPLYLGILSLATVLFVPMGLAGVLMLHAPAWRARRIGRLVGPYLVTGALALVAAVGIIGILEMMHFVVAADTTRPPRRPFWFAVAPRTLTAWLGFAALVVAAALGLRCAGPRTAA